MVKGLLAKKITCWLTVSLAFVMCVLLPTLNSVNVWADIGLVDTIQYMLVKGANTPVNIKSQLSVEESARAKAAFNGLIFCLMRADTAGDGGDMSFIQAVENGRMDQLNGSSGNTGDDLKDQYAMSVFGVPGNTENIDCSDIPNGVIRSAINIFAGVSKDEEAQKMNWDAYALPDKDKEKKNQNWQRAQDLFCSMPLHLEEWHFWSNDDRECSAVFQDWVTEGGTYGTSNLDNTSFIYDNEGKYGGGTIETFANFINDEYFDGVRIVGMPYNNFENAIVLQVLTRQWCMGDNKFYEDFQQKPLGVSNEKLMTIINHKTQDLNENSIALVRIPTYAVMEHDQIAPSYGKMKEFAKMSQTSGWIGGCKSVSENLKVTEGDTPSKDLESLEVEVVKKACAARYTKRHEEIYEAITKDIGGYKVYIDDENCTPGSPNCASELREWFKNIPEKLDGSSPTSSPFNKDIKWYEDLRDTNKDDYGAIFVCSINEYINDIENNMPNKDEVELPTYIEISASDVETNSAEAVIDNKELGSSNNIINYATDPCYDAAGAMAWILCPIIKSIGGALNSIYEWVADSFLAIDSYLVSSNSATHTAWLIFQRIANIILIIFFIIIIFSQLTGWGIDNYGIKKALPKIIAVAIIINISFIAAQLLVDLSNIAGQSLHRLFMDIPISVSNPALQKAEELNAGASSANGIFQVLLGGVTLGVAGVGVTSVVTGISQNGVLSGLIIPILLILIIAIFAILFIFLLLGLRKALIILLITIAPVAIVCYALPNTKKYYSKWWSAFSAMLIMFPVCGFVIGGSAMAAKIILLSSQSDFVTYFVGMMLMIVPYFFIPSLIKGSFKAVGNIGAKVSGIGKGLGSKTRSRVDSLEKNSQGHKRRAERAMDKRNMRMWSADAKRGAKAESRLQRKYGGDSSQMSARQQRKYGYASMKANEAQRRMNERNMWNNNVFVAGQTAKDSVDNANKMADAEMWSDSNFVSGQNAKASEERANRISEAEMWNDQGYRDLQSQKRQYAQREKMGEAAAGIFVADQDTFDQHAQARRASSEGKYYEEQIAGRVNTPSDLTQTINETIGQYGAATDNEGKEQAQRKLAAALRVAESRKMTDSVHKAFRGADQGIIKEIMSDKSGTVKSALAASQDKVLRAFGKSDVPEYESFVNGGGLSSYADNKGREFSSGLDDKALEAIYEASVVRDADNKVIERNDPGLSLEQLLRIAADGPKDSVSSDRMAEMINTKMDVMGQAGQANDIAEAYKKVNLKSLVSMPDNVIRSLDSASVSAITEQLNSPDSAKIFAEIDESTLAAINHHRPGNEIKRPTGGSKGGSNGNGSGNGGSGGTS